MSAPTAPTLSTLVAEALKLSGVYSPSSALTTRASTEWMRFLKNELWTLSKKWKNLQQTNIQTLTVGLPEYAYPADFSSDMEMTFLTGTRYGTAQAGTTTSLTGAAGETHEASEVIGRELVIHSGTGSGQKAYITGYNSTTKVYTLSPALTTAPDNTSGYFVAEYSHPITKKHISDLQNRRSQTAQGEPYEFFPEGDSAYGKYILRPVPYRTDSQPMAVLQRYYANLLTLDVDGSLMARLYQDWVNLWTKGIIWLSFMDQDDNRQIAGKIDFYAELRKLGGVETPNADANDIQTRVVD